MRVETISSHSRHTTFTMLLYPYAMLFLMCFSQFSCFIWRFLEKKVSLHLEIGDGHRSTSDMPYLFAVAHQATQVLYARRYARCTRTNVSLITPYFYGKVH